MSNQSKDPIADLPLSPLRFPRCGECGHKLPGHSTACKSKGEKSTEKAPTFSLAQIAQLKKEFGEHKTADVSILGKLHSYFKKLPDATLKQLACADIKWVSAIARNDCKTRGIDIGFTQAEKRSAKKCYIVCDLPENWYRVFGSYFDNLNKATVHFHEVCRAGDQNTAFALCNPNHYRYTILTAEAVDEQPVAQADADEINARVGGLARSVASVGGKLD